MELPAEFINRMKAMLGDEYNAFEAAFTSEEEYTGIRITKHDAMNIIQEKLGFPDNIPWCPNGFYADKTVISGKHPYHIAGLVYFQEPSATAPVCALPIESGDYVLDLCAAPGGKATQAAEKLLGTGLLVANEIISKRAEVLSENIERCGVPNAVVTNETPEHLAERFPEFFDKIIVDAPCSGEGMFRKEPKAVTEWSVAHTLSCAVRQRHILDCAVRMLRPGGCLIYSTCTFAPEENEENAEYIVLNYSDMSLVPIDLKGLSDGRSEWTKNGTDMSFTKRIFPHLARGEGHFMALFKKEGLSQKRKAQHFENAPKEFLDFEKNAFKSKYKGNFFMFGEHLYFMNEYINLDKIKILRAGLYMGICRKGRFEPSHALAIAQDKSNLINTVEFSHDSDELKKYLHGEAIPCDKNGWVCVLADGFPIGWGKASQGCMKNHFPKKYRL